MSRKTLVILILVFIATRGVGMFLAANPQLYGTSYSRITWDPILYGSWAFDIVDGERAPYSGVNIEYPPAVLPFAILPEVERAADDTYLIRFEFLMLAVDIAAFIGVLRLARRWGSSLGPWLWVAGLALLGPIAYTRLDLIPAFATVWALERMAAKSWFAGGGWMSFGALAKIYPALLMPMALIVTSQKRRFVSGIALVAFLLILPHLGALERMYDSVLGFHSSRGLHVESTWGAGVLTAGSFGYPSEVKLSFGSFNVESGVSSMLKSLGNVAALVALGVGTWRARSMKDDVAGLAALMYGTLAVILSVGTVFSPQFIMWLIALAAAAACRPSELLKGPLMTLLPVAFVTQIIYPFVYELLLEGNRSAVAVLASRNVLLLFSGLGVLSALKMEQEEGVVAPELNESMVVPSAALAAPET